MISKHCLLDNMRAFSVNVRHVWKFSNFHEHNLSILN